MVVFSRTPPSIASVQGTYVERQIKSQVYLRDSSGRNGSRSIAREIDLSKDLSVVDYKWQVANHDHYAELWNAEAGRIGRPACSRSVKLSTILEESRKEW